MPQNASAWFPPMALKSRALNPQVTQATERILADIGGFILERRGEVDVKVQAACAELLTQQFLSGCVTRPLWIWRCAVTSRVWDKDASLLTTQRTGTRTQRVTHPFGNKATTQVCITDKVSAQKSPHNLLFRTGQRQHGHILPERKTHREAVCPGISLLKMLPSPVSCEHALRWTLSQSADCIHLPHWITQKTETTAQ